MKLSRSLRLATVLVLASATTASLFAGAAEEAARAAALVERMIELNQKFSAYDVALAAPAPIAGSKGKYLLPIDENGALTGWAEKALNAQVGNIAGEQAGAAAAKGLGSVVPGGGLAGGFMKKKGKESGAMLALGGSEYVKSTSSLSFDSVESYAIYLHAKLGQSPDYSKAVQAAIALYPDIEKSYTTSVQTAYDAAVKTAAATKAAADAAAAEAAKIATPAVAGVVAGSEGTSPAPAPAAAPAATP